MLKTCSAIVASVPGAGRSRSAARASCRELAAALFSRDTGCRAHRMQICHDPAGAPQLWCDGVHSNHKISLSHSGDWVAVALSNKVNVGIDVEQIDKTRSTEKFGAFLGWNGNLSDPVEFYSKWTLWEACYKTVRGNVLAECNKVFEALDQTAEDTSISQACEWASFQGRWRDQISYTLVTHDERSGGAVKSFFVRNVGMQ